MTTEPNSTPTPRVPLPQKVSWMPRTFPAVNSTEYWAFRKEFAMTHHDYTVHETKKSLKVTDRSKIVDHLIRTWVIKDYASDDNRRQIAQFLSQLTARGWNRLINEIVVAIQMK